MGIKFRVTGSQAGRTRPRAIGVLALAKAKAGAEDRLKTEALGLVAPSRAEPGNISYDLHQGTEDTTTFVFYENWKSMEAFDSHKKSTHIQGFLTATKDLLDGALKVTLLNEISEPSEPERYKVARTRVPKTAEFKPYRDAKADQTKSDLMDAAAVAISRVAETHPERVKAGLRPDDLYETVMGEQGLSKSWEAAFGGEESGRQMFGLVAWTYFFNHSGHWLGTPSNRAGLGKRGWTYVAEPEPEKPAGAPVVPSPRRSGRRITMETTIAAAAVAPAPQAVPQYKFRLHQMVLVRGQGGKFGTIPHEITGMPDQEPDRDPDDPRYEVSMPKRFGPNIGEWIVERDLKAQV